MVEVNELEDFEAYLEPEFDSYRFAGDLLLGTNDHGTSELDVATSIKRLTFDVDEVEKRMTLITSKNYDSIMSNFSEIEKTRTKIKREINPSIDRVNSSFQKIQDEIIAPYDEAVKMNSALRKIHTTLELLRGSNIFFVLIQQLEELEKAVDSTDDSKTTNIIKLAKLHRQIKDLYENERQSKDTDVSLLSIKLVRDYNAIQMTKRHQLIEVCVEKILADCNHNSTFTPDNVALCNRLIALSIINESEFTSIVDKGTIAKRVQTASQQLTRSLQLPRNFIIILREVNNSCSEFLTKLEKILLNSEVIFDDDSHATSLLEKVLADSQAESLHDILWPRLALIFKKSVASTMARGGPIAKYLRIYYEGIRKEVIETYGEGDMLEAVELISHGR